MSKNLIKVAIADDHTVMRKGIATLIDSFGDVRVILDAVDGEDLLNKLERANELPDICVLDINMPVMNGYDTAAAIRAKWDDMKILALSMINEEFSVVRMLRNGANGYIVKDCNPIDLHNALLGVYHNSFYHSELVTSKLLYNLFRNASTAPAITEKEIEFLSYCCTDLTYKQIASKMNISPRTIDDYRDSLFKKLQIKSRTALAIFAIKLGFCNPKQDVKI
jgi:two-component system, NarL family, invasion response regulator UvrY